VLREDGGVVVRRWDAAEERIVPSAYTVELRLKDGGVARVIEDEEGLWVEEARGGAKVARGALARAQVRLPRFDDSPFGPVLRALHHEILVGLRPKVRGIARAYADVKLAAPHTWQAAEMFLQLADRVPGYIEAS
jgi:hypothetical protein